MECVVLIEMRGYAWLLIFPTDDDEIIVKSCLFYQRRNFIREGNESIYMCTI
jgi:hypothetical protein